MKKISNFKKDLQKGLLGQQLLVKLFKHIENIDGRRGDLSCGVDKIELKTDSYNMKDTLNFFIEHYSSIEALKLGGPWQALKHDCKYFVYLYQQNMCGFVFNTSQLVSELETLLLKSHLKPINIKNLKWTTVGYKIPRCELTPIMEFSSKEIVYDFEDLANKWGFVRSTTIADAGFNG